MKIGIYPGSFDPVTSGHIDIIERAAKLVDKLYVAVLYNHAKGTGLFSVDERVDMLEETTKHISNVVIESFSGLLVDYMTEKEADIIVRGIRNSLDLENERQLAEVNKALENRAETVFFLTAPQYAHVSSSTVRELHYFGRMVKGIVPPYVEMQLKNKRVKE